MNHQDEIRRNQISVELVPRDSRSLHEELEVLHQHFRGIDAINIPDLLRFDIRSWEACAMARTLYPETIAHVRAIDMHPYNPLPLRQALVDHCISGALVIAGDPPQNAGRQIYPSTSIEMLRKFHQEIPEVRLYAAIDPYRSSFRSEIDYVRRKHDAGAAGFFTQPFFDLRLMEIYAELLADYELWFGIAPVLSQRSRNYWETRNRTVFPADFEPTLEWNQSFARSAMEYARAHGFNLYFMPIRTDLRTYLSGILPPAAGHSFTAAQT